MHNLQIVKKNNDSPLASINDCNFWNLMCFSTSLSKHNEQRSRDYRSEGESRVSMFGWGTVAITAIKSGKSVKEPLTQGPQSTPAKRICLSRWAWSPEAFQAQNKRGTHSGKRCAQPLCPTVWHWVGDSPANPLEKEVKGPHTGH